MSVPTWLVCAEPLLSPDEVVRLASAVEAGLLAGEARRGGSRPDATDAELRRLEADGEAARLRLVRANLRLVAMVARQQARRSGLVEADLFQEGCLGLLVAVARYDHRRGHAFSTYALFWVRALVGAASARRLGALELPAKRAVAQRTARGVEAALAQQLGRPPDRGELASAIGWTEQATEALLAHDVPEPLRPELVERLATTDHVDLGADVDLVALLDELPAAERTVLRLRFGFDGGRPSSTAATARRLGWSDRRVHRVEGQALDRLRGLCPQSAREQLGA